MSPRAFEIQRYRPFVRRLAVQLRRQLRLPCEVEELTAWGQLGLLEAWARFDPAVGVGFPTFASHRIRGAILDGLRKMGGGGLPPPALAAAEVEPPADERLHLEQLRRRLRHGVARLPERERRLLQGHYFEELTLQEAGAAFGQSKSWASRLHARALARLRRLVEEVPT